MIIARGNARNASRKEDHMGALVWTTTTRYYRVRVQKDLFGGLSVVCYWGSRRSRHGSTRRIPCHSYQDVRAVVRSISKARRRQGYVFGAVSVCST